MHILLSEPAEMSLAYIIKDDTKLGTKLFSQLKYRLPYDPYPDIDDEEDTFNSAVVEFLDKQGYEVHRLKSKEFLNYRVFYFVDEEDELIYILEIIRRDHAYKTDAKHVQTIKELYIQYYTNKK